MYDENSSISKNALMYLGGQTEHVCRLCFASTNKQEVSLDDTIFIKRSFLEEKITFFDMLKYLEITSEHLLPQVLCTECATATANCYAFKKLLEHSNQKWLEIITQLENGLTHTDAISTCANSLYLIVKDKTSFVVCSKKKHFKLHKKSAMHNLNTIMYSKQKYLKNKDNKPKEFFCDKCGMQCFSKYQLLKHTNKHSGTKSPCRHCKKVFVTQMELEKHIERIHLPKTIKCMKCNKMFSTERQLDYHEKRQHVAVICKPCHLSFPSRSALQRHQDSHVSQECPKCFKKIFNKHTYKLHISRCGDDPSNLNFFCDICSKGYMRKNGLRSHLKVDHGFGKVLCCHWCGKKFDAVSKLRNHEVKHTRERKFICQECGGKFVTQAALVYHTRLHTGERPFPCDMCSERFLSASRRMEHKRRKHLEPSEECSICCVKFIGKSHLNKHMKLHLNPQSKLYVHNYYLYVQNKQLKEHFS